MELSDEQILAAFPANMGAVRVPPGWREWAKNIAAATLRAQTAASRDVLAERQRQIDVEGWTFGHDDSHNKMQMAEAAATYALNAAGWHLDHHRIFWPWTSEWFKPTDRRRDLVKAGALILAEIERLDRAAQAGDA